MKPEEREQAIPHEVSVTLQGKEIRLVASSESEVAPKISVEVKDITNKTDIASEAEKEIVKRFWFADPIWEKQELRDRLRVEFGERSVEIFIFGLELTPETRESIIRTLTKMYRLLKDKRSWNLESIQILPREDVNEKNGEFIRAAERPDQRRLELYPAGLRDTPYRDGELPCTELEGSLVHELTHVLLEDDLRKAWELEDLGWKMAEVFVYIELPGGSRTKFYNERPVECPTSYACLQQDDDRAESVVAYLFAQGRLDQKRKRILDPFFGELTHEQPVTTSLPATLPELPDQLRLEVKQQRDLTGMFRSVSTSTESPQVRFIPLAEFRRQKNIQDR